jgi:hypothetical protein
VKRLLLLQLPQPENAVGAARENIPLAAAYLRRALRCSPEGRFWRVIRHPRGADAWDDRSLADWIVRARPDAIAATLYVWNVERTLDLLRRVRTRLPAVRVAVGGPEVAPGHPFLFRAGVVDAAATGEGEPAFPKILSAFRSGRRPAIPWVGWRHGERRFRWSRGPEAGGPGPLLLPPPADPSCRPDTAGMAYLETGRGCALKCTFCCYNQRRRRPVYLCAGEVLRRVAVLLARGARDIRVIDPTFNANPDFEEIVHGLAALNRGRKARFFAELRGDTVTRGQARILARANFAEIEIGVQSRDAGVLRAIRRPPGLDALDAGVGFLSRAGIRLTLDVMAGLPGQTRTDVRRSVRWAASVRGARVQVLHTLLLPGTELRDNARRLGLEAQALPPYRVLATRQMPAADLAAAELEARRITGEVPDIPTRRFVGADLPDLFAERVVVDVATWRGAAVPGREVRRAVVMAGDDLFAGRDTVLGVMRRAMADEPHALWQFVVSPRCEEPLDLIEAMTEEIGRFEDHFLDRMVFQPDGRRHVARRVFVLLRRGRRYDARWVRAADDYLRDHYW